jgi:ubiquinone/menaquinone biosynthesis C-methylase UbiE/DNA-binding transcriptional ArsR family regulator
VASPLSDVMRLLGDQTRLRILHMLSTEPLTVGELQDLLDLSQSSVSGHLSKLKRAGFLHAVAEGSSHRYRLREDLRDVAARAWSAIRQLSATEPDIAADAQRVQELLGQRGQSWVERVAGSLHRAYAPGRTWETLAHGFAQLLQLGRCADIGAGDGTMIELLAPHATALSCIDPAPVMVAATCNRIAELGLSSRCRAIEAAAEALPLADASQDTVLFLQSLHYVEDPGKALAEAQRVLAPGGRLLVLTLVAHEHPDSERYGHRHRGFRAEELRRWCRGVNELAVYELAPEARAPRFQSLVVSGRK